ncbi:dipeptidase PepE [Microbacterium trichothecenolyticum]|uniref:Dipeptidase PepE n=1 Tax=Microbacterium ureisolvens TaxID=2781186 RepID=A0ABS7HZD1_9MICO|nr:MULTISPECIES: dipeptidase PepE [Microbacterium]MBW9110433.1 dipeptidase PepE [Microbacterium ureisolvens]MBW9120538.1 dipeptidase PepE [Microbacterium trichothecenolyticum]
MKRHLLLISNSTQPGRPYLEHCLDEMASFLADARSVLFVPYAMQNVDAYADAARNGLRDLGVQVSSIHRAEDPLGAVRDAEAIFIGGGNTFRLLDRLARSGLLGALRSFARAGGRYMGTSAGSNMAGPTIKTTNDMPIIYPPTFDALDIVSFNINPHYADRDPDVPHDGETRSQRIAEFHEIDSHAVIGLREQTMLLVDGTSIQLRGSHAGAKVFRQGQPPTEHHAGEFLDHVLEPHTTLQASTNGAKDDRE